MDTVYRNCLPSVDTSTAALPVAVLSFYRWLWRWYHQTGDVSPSTPYFALKQKKTERTIYRWLAVLKAAGWITTEVVEGVERSIVPLVEPPAKPRSRKKMSGVRQGSMSGVPPYSNSDALDTVTTNAETAPAAPEGVACPVPPASPVGSDAVSAGADGLIAVGVPQRVAVQLVQAHGTEAAKKALEAYRAASKVSNPVGWMIRAVEKGYQAPRRAVEGSTEATERAKRFRGRLEAPKPVNGLTGKAALDALRDRLRLAGRV